MKFIAKNWFNFFCAAAIVYFAIAAIGANAQDKITNLRVVCAAGKDPRTFTNAVEADKYAQSRPCAGRTYVEANYYYLSSSSKSSTSSAKSSSSASNSSVAPLVSAITANCPTARESGEPMALSDIDHYELIRDSRTEIIAALGCEINYITTSPKPNEKFYLVTAAKVGGKSKPIEVAQ